MAKYSYRLCFDVKVKDRAGTESVFTLENDVDKEIAIGDVTYSTTLGGITFNRKIYQPGEIEAEMFIGEKTDHQGSSQNSVLVSSLSGLLLKSVVSLYFVNRDIDGTESGKKLIAQNYYVHEMNPRLVKQSDDTYRLFIRLSIFSMDKLMTLEKSAKTYVAKKLGSGIMSTECKKFFIGSTTLKENHDHRQYLRYIQKIIGPNKQALDIPSEVIQPYLVQYNETFYDFLARTANRCGEFLYYEDGQLILGLPDSGEPKLVGPCASVTYQCISVKGGYGTLYSRDSIKDGQGEMDDTNYTRIAKNTAGFPRDLFPREGAYHSELSSDEYFFPLYLDKFTSLSRETGYTGLGDDVSTSQIFPVMASAMTSTDGATDFGAAIAADKVSKATAGAEKVASVNKAGNEKYIKKINAVHGNGQTSVLFGSVEPEGWTTLNYYNAIRHYEESLQKDIICIDMGNHIENVILGQKIKIEENGETYIVIQIVMTGDNKWSNEYDKYEADTDIAQKTGGLSQKIFAIPMAEMNVGDQVVKKPFPPLLSIPFIRHAEPQTAFVTDNNDPKYQGRVRIVYPWQPEFEEVRKLRTAETNYALALADLAAKTKKLKTEQATLEKMQKEYETLQKGQNEAVKVKLLSAKAVEEQIKKLNETEKKSDEDLKKLQDNARTVAASLANPQTATVNVQEFLASLTENEMIFLQLFMAKDNFEGLALMLKAMDKEAFKDYVNKAKETLEAQKKAVENAKKDVEKAQTEVENKKKDLDAAIVLYKKEIINISSPWIRVATPMATDGGGTFFKPMMGDEVLVNYEGGNVERPYVVGSLFSKNTLAPDERINRTVGPNLHTNASIAIVSPNGHAITFKDPTDSSDFVSSVYPAFGPIKSLVDLPLPTSKDVTGGIRIGDRFGLYSIDMSSNKRSVSISSTMGNVKLDAYTGITITAPNGEVKIKGKNVTIEAGNNLSLLSGNNIKKKADTTKTSSLKGKAASAVDKAADKGSAKATDKVLKSPLDAYLFRTVLETFLKPIEGTMCIKSKRYMKLEAGPGKTIINQDRYKDWDASKKKKAAKSQDFFRMMIEHVSQLDARLNDFTMRYRAMWMDAYTKKEAYVKAEAELCTKGIVDDLITKAYDLKPDADWKDNAFKVSALEGAKLKKMQIGKSGTFKLRSDEDRKSEMLPQANALGEAVHALRTHIESFSKLFEDMGDSGASYIDKSLKDAFESFRYKVSTKVMSEYGTDLKGFLNSPVPKDTFVKSKMILKRKVAAAFVAKVAGDPAMKEGQFLKVNYKAEEVTDDQVQDNYLWSSLVQGIGSAPISPLLKSIADHIKENAGKSLSLDEWKKAIGDQEVWDDRKGGQILFSDDENSTVNFDRGALHVERGANSYNMDRLKQLLTGLKE